MKLHIFNPEHDVALAYNRPFTPSHHVRQLRSDLAFLPAIWADDGDGVLVDDVSAAIAACRKISKYARDVLFLTDEDLMAMPQKARNRLDISPWGWDSSLVSRLQKAGIPPTSMPSARRMNDIRLMSSRRWAAEHILPHLVASHPACIGTSAAISHRIQLSSGWIARSIADNAPVVLKSPWSSSGRGVRFIPASLLSDPHTPVSRWMQRIIDLQGSVMIEPQYRKILDFGVEFFLSGGHLSLCGISLFRTTGASYDGSIIATEADKRQLLARHLSLSVFDEVTEHLRRQLETHLAGLYDGALGVDMMIVAERGQLRIHPCVEVNLRRTMGHTALAIPCDEHSPQRLLRIEHNGRFHLRLLQTGENLLDTTLL